MFSGRQSVTSRLFRAEIAGMFTRQRCQLLALALLGCANLLPLQSAEDDHDFARWEKDIAAFEAMDRTNPPPKGALLFIGSSTIRMWSTLAQDFPEHQVINRGFGGSEIADSTHFSERIVFPYEPRMILFRAGGNDLWNGKSPEQVFTNYQEFVATVQAKLSETEIAWISWDHTPSRWKQADEESRLNELVKEFSRRSTRLRYIETGDMVMGPAGHPRPELFLPDRLHFNAEGYQLLAERVRPHLPK
jgi:lysophospholipase L1-like esterase